MTRLYKALAVLALLIGVAHVVPAQATADFTVSKSVSAGTFTLTNNSNDLFVDELVVAGTGATAGTTLPGWSATAFFFNDPLNCLGGTGFNVGSGFCYKLTDSTVGMPIGQGSETFTYNSSFDDQSVPSNFFVLFTNAAGANFACAGTTNRGCNLPVPEPAPLGLFVVGLLGVAVAARRRVSAMVAKEELS